MHWKKQVFNMRKLEMLPVALLLFAIASSTASAQYWFQTGARGSDSAAFNSGASVAINTVYQNVTYGSLGFWVGETLENGAFVQIGYEITNQSGEYPTNCSPSGCTNNTYIQAGVPTWFWEYFPAGYNGGNFYGGIGPNASAGANGSFNTYSFKSSGNTWNFYFNGQLVGSTDLGTSSSGANPPVAFGEYAGAESNTTPIEKVTFRNLEFYNGNSFLLVPEAYSYIGYGKGSETLLSNMYGISEVNNRVDYFEVGSSLPLLNHTTLWKLGYTLKISSQYGNLTGENGNYSADLPVEISAPQYVYISNGTREAFEGWAGSGMGSYTGSNENATIFMYDNITERALWQTQYLVSISNGNGVATGSGWYDAGSAAHVSAGAAYVNTGAGSRIKFEGWSNGLSSMNLTVNVAGPIELSPIWQQQYLVNASSTYGSVKGGGWYNSGATATLSLSVVNISEGSSEKIGFYSWSNGSNEEPLTFAVSKPVFITAFYKPMYLTELVPVDAYNASLSGVAYNINGNNYSTNYIYMFAGRQYSIAYAVYKGAVMGINKQIAVSSPESATVKLPVYDVRISTKSLFGTPANAKLELAFKNGTHIETTTGANGTLMLYDVPYGYVNGSVYEMGVPMHIKTEFGSGVQLTVLTPLAIEVIAIGIVAVFSSVVVGEMIERRRKAAPKS